MGGRGSTGGNNPGSGKAKEDILSMSAQMKAARQREAAQARNNAVKSATISSNTKSFKNGSSVTDAKNQTELNQKLAAKGLVLDSAYQRAANGEKVTLYDSKGNEYTGTFNKYKDGGREIMYITKVKGRRK